ncbi:MAG: TetR family transcriptional regulator [Azospirillum sp.]|nr:TetR family transcriptional regulator [Azospirillum sp.]
MARTAADTRKRILEAGYQLIYREGFARTSVDDVAAAAGVTKRTLYYHFDGKDALIGAMLEHQNELALARIAQWAVPAGGDPSELVEAVFADLALWAASPGWLGSGFTRLTMELAALPDHPARTMALRHKLAVERWLGGQLAACRLPEPEAIARQLMLLIEGCQALILIHRDPAYAEAAVNAARTLVGKPTRR